MRHWFTLLEKLLVAVPILVSVPATTANIGPGFDCLGAALSLYNRFRFTQLEAAPGTVSINVFGEEAARVATDASNLAYLAFAQFFERLQLPTPAIEMTIELDVPLARGLGSSSTAIIGGLLGANALTNHSYNLDQIAALATEIEGHPDNVVPALMGGCQLAVADNDDWTLCPIAWHEEIVPVVAIPNFELSTASARAVLPSQYSRSDAIFNAAHLGLLLRALETGNDAWLRQAMADRIHQPYRKSLIPGYEAVAKAALDAGAYGVVISGAGPTLLALTSHQIAPSVQQAICQTWQQNDVTVRAMALQLERQGAQVSSKFD